MPECTSRGRGGAVRYGSGRWSSRLHFAEYSRHDATDKRVQCKGYSNRESPAVFGTLYGRALPAVANGPVLADGCCSGRSWRRPYGHFRVAALWDSRELPMVFTAWTSGLRWLSQRHSKAGSPLRRYLGIIIRRHDFRYFAP